MVAWSGLEALSPETVDIVERNFALGKHKTLATVTRSGAPRISGIEVVFRTGNLMLGSRPGSVKSLDLLRDPRMALHGPTGYTATAEEQRWEGDVKITGTASRDHSMSNHQVDWFAIDIASIVFASLDEFRQKLVQRLWTTETGLVTVSSR